MTNKKLYRSTKDKIIAGVCGGLGEYFNIDSTIIRILFVLLALADGAGILIYLVMALIVPKKGGSEIKDNAKELAGKTKEIARDWRASEHSKSFFGIVIVFIGLIVLLKNLTPVDWPWFRQEIFWSLLIIVIGFYLVVQNKKS